MATRKSPSRESANTPEKSLESATESMAANQDPPRDPVESDSGSLLKAPAEQADKQPRFHFFIIDAGWKSSSARVIRENFHMIREFLDGDPLYILSREQSVALIRANPDLVGKDPVILVHDLQAKGGRGESGYHGFRLCLGLIKDGQEALASMQKFLRFVHFHRNSPNIEKDIKQRLHRKGLEGAIEVLGSGAQELMGG